MYGFACGRNGGGGGGGDAVGERERGIVTTRQEGGGHRLGSHARSVDTEYRFKAGRTPTHPTGGPLTPLPRRMLPVLTQRNNEYYPVRTNRKPADLFFFAPAVCLRLWSNTTKWFVISKEWTSTLKAQLSLLQLSAVTAKRFEKLLHPST